jgi:hypothetical protein
MTAAVGGKVSQARVRSITEGGDVRASQMRVRAIYNFPSVEMRSSQMRVRSVFGSGPDVRVSQMRVRAIIKGRDDNHRVRAWTFALDGHDFYVLQLGEQETLVCDLSTGQWAEWKSPERAIWRACLGINWIGMGAAVLNSQANRNNVICGDDGFGVLWVMDPEQAYDQHPVDKSEQAFTRVAMGGVAMRMRETVRNNEVYLLCAKGSAGLTLAAPVVSLRTSDDAEHTWVEQGDITVVSEDWSQEIVWRSLGVIGAPGRAFQITDNCIPRLDGLDMK